MTETLTWNVDVNDPQAIFDKVANHLHNASGRSMADQFGRCAYRGTSGRRCAVGALFEGTPTAEYNDAGVHRLIKVMDVQPPVLCIELMQALQSVHDFTIYWNEFGFTAFSALAYVASRFNLEYTPPQAVKS